MGTLDDEIGKHLAAAAQAGELKAAPSYGKPLAQMEGWDETPEEFRLAFKMLKESGFVPPEIALFQERARLRALVEGCEGEERVMLMKQLSDLEQKISLRLEALRVNGSL